MEALRCLTHKISFHISFIIQENEVDEMTGNNQSDYSKHKNGLLEFHICHKEIFFKKKLKPNYLMELIS